MYAGGRKSDTGRPIHAPTRSASPLPFIESAWVFFLDLLWTKKKKNRRQYTCHNFRKYPEYDDTDWNVIAERAGVSVDKGKKGTSQFVTF